MVPLPAFAQAAAMPAITGILVDQAGGVPVSHATVRLYVADKRVAEVQTDANGRFSFSSVPAGIYHIEIRAEGYQGLRGDDVSIVPGAATTTFRAVLQRASTSSGGLQEIGRVSASSGRNSISTSTTISQTVSGDVIAKEGFNRIGDALNTLPGLNTTGISSSIGDDLNVDFRGFGSSETQTLLDGHPIGPFGPGSGGFSFQVSPGYAIGETRVTYGSGALGLYGTDSIGGTVDLQSLSPTRTAQFALTQGFGNLGRKFTSLQATGTVGRVGYALVHAVDGSYGPWAPAQRPQPGLLGLDISSANLAANTYSTSGNYKLTNDLLKLRYAFDDKTQLTVSALSATSWDDKSGNGDNCYFTPQLQLYKGQQIIAAGANTYPAGANPGDPGSITCTGSIAVNTNGGPACIGAAQYAAATTGLAGGGPGPFQAHRVLDFHGRLTKQLGNNILTLDGFTNRYTTDYNRNLAGGLDPSGSFFTGGFDSSFYQTTGLLISDDIVTNRNDVGFGFYGQHQRITGDKFDTQNFVIVPTQEFGLGLSNFFVRDDYHVSDATQIYLNAWLKRSTVTQRTTFDPRLSFVFRLSPADVLRLTGGRSDGEPSPVLTQQLPNLNTTYQNITPSCGGLTGVGNVSNPGLQPETSNDLELGYGHRFAGDSLVQLDVYESFEKNRIFGGVLPVSVLGPNAIPSYLLAGYFNRIQQFCGTANPTLADLSVNTNYNASSARYQGIELSGRYRFNRRFYVDYSYDVQSAVNLNVPNSILMSNVTLINGSQLVGIPLHKASVGFDYTTLHGFEARTDVYYLDDNNSYNRPRFFYGNASFSAALGPHTALNVGVQNIFNSAASRYNQFGAAPFVAENQFGTDTSALQQAFSGNGGGLNGLLQPQYSVSITVRK